MSTQLNLNDTANFTWCWTNYWFLETANGNYAWSDPFYGGDNTIRRYQGTFFDFMNFIYQDKNQVWLGRERGNYQIGKFCGTRIKIND